MTGSGENRFLAIPTSVDPIKAQHMNWITVRGSGPQVHHIIPGGGPGNHRPEVGMSSGRISVRWCTVAA
jgi:hypothetical protein